MAWLFIVNELNAAPATAALLWSKRWFRWSFYIGAWLLLAQAYQSLT